MYMYICAYIYTQIFWNFGILGEVNIFLISVGVIFCRGRSVHSPFFSHFEMQDLKNSKIFACGALIFNMILLTF